MNERQLMNVSERSLSDTFVLSHHGDSSVILSRTPVSEDVMEYSVQSHIAIEREAIDALMRAPLGRAAGDWHEVRDGLKDISYPSRRVKSLARTAGLSLQLSAVRQASRELAEVLDYNQDYRDTSANIPVFTYAQAHQYTARELVSHSTDRRLLAMIKSLGVDPATARRLSLALRSHENSTYSPAEEAELRAITMFSDQELIEIQNSALLEQIEPRLVAELIERVREKNFSAFGRIAQFNGSELTGGTKDSLVYVLDEDVPREISYHAAHISIGALKRDRDRKRDLARYGVTFYTEGTRYVSVPKIAWRKSRDGKRELVFSGSPWQPNQAIRPSTIAGAALAATVLGSEIDYGSQLNKLARASNRSWHLPHHLPAASAGYWPLVATYKQDELLADSYFEETEQRLD